MASSDYYCTEEADELLRKAIEDSLKDLQARKAEKEEEEKMIKLALDLSLDTLEKENHLLDYRTTPSHLLDYTTTPSHLIPQTLDYQNNPGHQDSAFQVDSGESFGSESDDLECALKRSRELKEQVNPYVRDYLEAILKSEEESLLCGPDNQVTDLETFEKGFESNDQILLNNLVRGQASENHSRPEPATKNGKPFVFPEPPNVTNHLGAKPKTGKLFPINSTTSETGTVLELNEIEKVLDLNEIEKMFRQNEDDDEVLELNEFEKDNASLNGKAEEVTVKNKKKKKKRKSTTSSPQTMSSSGISSPINRATNLKHQNGISGHSSRDHYSAFTPVVPHHTSKTEHVRTSSPFRGLPSPFLSINKKVSSPKCMKYINQRDFSPNQGRLMNHQNSRSPVRSLAKHDSEDQHKKFDIPDYYLSEGTGSPRPIFVDGCNVGFACTKDKEFSAKGLESVYYYFQDEYGYTSQNFTIVLKGYGKTQEDRELIERFYKMGILLHSPFRKAGDRIIQSDDDLFVLSMAKDNGGIVISRDQFRDARERYIDDPSMIDLLDNRLLSINFNSIQDKLYPVFALDPLGSNGPTLRRFLQF